VFLAFAFLAFGAMSFDMQFLTNYNLSLVGCLFIALAFLVNRVESRKTRESRKSIKDKLCFEIQNILETLDGFLKKYEDNIKDAWKYDGIVTSTNPPETVPAQFKHPPPELRQKFLKSYFPFHILSKKEAIEVAEFCNKIKDIVLLYEQLRTTGPQDFELTEQWETLVSEVIEKGNPLKPHNNRFHDDGQKNGRV